MKILHIIPTVDPTHGGPVEGVRSIGDVLAERGIVQELLTLDDAADPVVAKFGRRVFAMGAPRPAGSGLWARFVRWARFSPKARDWARAHVGEYDAVVVNSLWNYCTRVARLSLVGSGVPYVVYPHGMLDPWFKRKYPFKHLAKQLLWLFNEGILLRHADAVMFICDEERLLARKTFSPYSVKEHVVAYGAAAPPPAEPGDEAEFRSLVPALGNRRYLLFMSRIHEKKGCDLLIRAFGQYAHRNPEVDLVMAGPDHSNLRVSLEALARDLGVDGRIHWPGMITGPAKYGALRGADAFVLPSHQENFGIVVAEALACSCPVLISNQVNIWREIAAANAGLVEDDTLAGTVALLDRFSALSSAQRTEMAIAGKALFEEQFDMAAGARELATKLEEIIKSNK